VETEKGEEGMVGGSWNGGGEGAGRGLGNASCIGEHKRSRNNTIGRRAKHRLTRVRTFRAPTRVALLHVVRAGIRKKGTSVRAAASSCSSKYTRVYARRNPRPSTSANEHPIFIRTSYTGRTSRKSRRASAKGGSKVDLLLPSEIIQDMKYAV